MKVLPLVLIILLYLTTYGYAFPSYPIDNFEDIDLNFNPEWYHFGSMIYSSIPVIPNKNSQLKKLLAKLHYKLTPKEPLIYPKELGNYALQLKGNGKEWYVGGLGTYLGISLKSYKTLSIWVKGNGISSGRLKIELFDDDNNNWRLEQDIKNQFEPLHDDKFVFMLTVDWSGWKKIDIPLTDFIDENPDIGDDTWNPYQTGTSGGLLQLQIIGLTSHDLQSNLDISIDDIWLN